ncbi:MAG: RNA methyltransferase [Anaerolinea sp.]|nr:RNA methyltransferase [Anaerolinea sp.]
MSISESELITSSKNQHVQHIRELLAKKSVREDHSSFVVEGVRLCEEAMKTGIAPRLVVYSDTCSDRGLELVQQASTAGSKVFLVKHDILDALSDTATTQGLLMVMQSHPLPLPETLDFILVVDRVRDPGNLGTILRTAVAAGVQAVFCTPGSVDAWSPKVVRSAMGAHFYVPIELMKWEEILGLCNQQKKPLTTFLAESGDGASLWQADLKKPIALVIGGEAEGASPEVKAGVDALINIPMPGGFESLNAAIAASIILFEVVRQRSI